MKGWDYARAHPDETVKIVLDNDASGAQTEAHQKHMMDEINKLTEGTNGVLDPADYDRTVKTLLSSGLGSGHHQGAARRLDPCGHRQGRA